MSAHDVGTHTPRARRRLFRWPPEAISARFVALVAGVGFFFLAVITQGVLPFIEPVTTALVPDVRPGLL